MNVLKEGSQMPKALQPTQITYSTSISACEVGCLRALQVSEIREFESFVWGFSESGMRLKVRQDV